jgi:hypothetical protein
MACRISLRGGHVLLALDRDFTDLIENSDHNAEGDKYITMQARRDGTQAGGEKPYAVRARDIVAIEDLG